jgi:hypothetical protein
MQIENIIGLQKKKLLVASSLILYFAQFLKWLHVLYTSNSDFFRLFLLAPVTTADSLVSFHLIILIILRRNMTYDSSIHNKLDWHFTAVKMNNASFIFYNSFQIISSANMHISVKTFKATNIFEKIRYFSLHSTSFNFLRLNLTTRKVCDLCLFTASVSLNLPQPDAGQWIVTLTSMLGHQTHLNVFACLSYYCHFYCWSSHMETSKCVSEYYVVGTLYFLLWDFWM